MSMKMDDNFEKNVFVNCPFDREYLPLLQPILFTLVYLKFNPRIASERFDSGETRFSKICEIIQQSKYGIHDLSRIKAKKKGEYFRLNMPFELGLDIGCRIFNSKKFQTKRLLVLEEEKYRFQAALSDLSNSDIKSHENEATKVVQHVRNWFVENGIKSLPSPTTIWYSFTDFMKDLDDKRINDGFHGSDIYEMPIPEYIDYVKSWIKTL